MPDFFRTDIARSETMFTGHTHEQNILPVNNAYIRNIRAAPKSKSPAAKNPVNNICKTAYGSANGSASKSFAAL